MTSGAEARVKRRESLQPPPFLRAGTDAPRRLTRGARLRYAGPADRAARRRIAQLPFEVRRARIVGRRPIPAVDGQELTPNSDEAPTVRGAPARAYHS